MRFGIVVFPGTWSDTDTYNAVRSMGYDAQYLWHKERDISGLDAIVLPGGFSYGDYLRCGAIARFSPVMESVTRFANEGGLVYGICNGFQILCEAGLLPGVLMRNAHLEYRCQWVDLRVAHNRSPFTLDCTEGQVLRVPISHGEGNYFADEQTLDDLESNNQVLFRYCTPEGAVTPDANPNGTARNIAGITNRRGNVLGMMPHPERAVEALLGSVDGRPIFASMARHVERLAMAGR